ncbi:hypothetical protein [Pectobacterium sp. IFB5596]|uniref:hypothetical protein n=1 Tax=Pectobacterium sp. IFB5596 TaxID=1839803 RepID=UPI001F4404FB|nr:hypothetical protein [Pectobacterium sp. IFB5596]MCE9730723.1 hypothetical protein [Pectobacterium sp. IFB5596]
MKKVCSISEIISQYDIDIEFIISEWMMGKFCIFTHFDGELCTMRHALDYERKSKDFIFHDAKFHLNCKTDIFQGINSPLQKQLSFIPEQPLDDHFRSEYKVDWTGPFFKGYDEIMYEGRAYGYWYLKPTKTTHFGRGYYLLSDSKNFDELKNKAGAVFVSAFKNDKYSYLIFDTPVKIGVGNMFLESDIVSSIIDSHKKLGGENVNNIDSIGFIKKEKIIKDEVYFPPNSRYVIYMLINEIFSRNGVVVYYKLTVLFKSNGISINQTTVKEWSEKRPKERSKPFRDSSRNNEIISVLLSTYLKEKKITGSNNVIASHLTLIANSAPYHFDIEFTPKEVSVWLNH